MKRQAYTKRTMEVHTETETQSNVRHTLRGQWRYIQTQIQRQRHNQTSGIHYEDNGGTYRHRYRDRDTVKRQAYTKSTMEVHTETETQSNVRHTLRGQ